MAVRAKPRHALPGVGFNLQDNMYFGQNRAPKFKAKGHRRQGTELPKIVVRNNGLEDFSNTDTQNNSTLSSMHRDLMIRRPKKPNELSETNKYWGSGNRGRMSKWEQKEEARRRRTQTK